MTTAQKIVPKWILLVSGFFALMEIMVSISIYLTPESVLEKVDLNAGGVEYLVNMWASRQFALGIIFAVAAIKKSAPMLTITYVFFLVMFIGDMLIGISQKENVLIGTALIMCIISTGMLYMLNKKN